MKLKKILIFCILIFSIIFISEASAEKKDILEKDGTDWTTNPDLFRIGYVSGFLAGAGVIRDQFYAYGYFLQSKLDKEIHNKILNKINLSEITVGQIMDGMNVFYNDFSNRRIKIVDAIYIVKMQIKGEDPELINSQIRYLKMQPIDIKIHLKKYVAFYTEKGRNPTYKEIKNGDFSFEDLLRAAMFIDASNNLHNLFCYGVYK